MQGSVIRRTQELLGRVIRKPPLTERLLSKPPFRYLHDVIGEVIRSTGFMKGLYTEAEMKSDNVKDKDAKIIFLQKAIDVVIMVTGEHLAVKPARVVAGYEPEKTNEFLQAIAKCCLNKLSSDEAVQKVLAEEKTVKEKTPSSKSQNRESKTEECRSHKEGRSDSEIKDKSTIQDQKVKEELKGEETKQRESEKHKDYENHPNNFDKTVNENEKHEKERIKNRLSKSGREPEKIRDKEKGEGEGEKEEYDKERDKERKQYEGGREKEKLREKDKPKDRDKDCEKVRDRGKEKDKRREKGKDIETAREERKDKTDKKPTGSEENISKKLAEKSINKDQTEFDKENENSARLSKQHATKGPRQRNKTSAEGESFGDAEGDVLNTGTTEKMSENNEFTNEIPPQITQRRLPRPSSARPAPPRIKRQQSTEILIPERNGSAKMVSNVIIDKEEEEDDQFIVKAEQQLPEITELKMEATVELEGDEKHGSLVQRILETKKDYEMSQLQKSAEKNHRWCCGTLKNRTY
ncbi:TRAF3-interacting protein 1 isoform X2 [Pseudonaja textilis]|uniref:TRAF3-interacting protein 1 isoform X2 n=1 Tax=Pseudonaja textilis TaxID=8673 RepID=UPI000EA94CBC|nr:TRAF3-interacting protein 1 isoform X2 [Pseudonaja textilis]